MRVYELARIEAAFPPVAPEVPAARPRGDAPARKSRTHPAKRPSEPLPSATVEELLSSVGPGNWHMPVLRAVAKLVAQGKSDDAIFALTDPCTLPGYTAEQTRNEVRAMIVGARRKGFTKPKRPSGPLKPDVPPAYPAFPMPPDEAVCHLNGVIEDWFSKAGRFALARRELGAFQSQFHAPGFHSFVRSEMLEEGLLPAPAEEVEALTTRHERRIRARELKRFKKKLLKKFGLSTLNLGPRLVVQAAAGLGKTHEVVRYIKAHPELWRLRIWLFVPTLDLAEQLAESFGASPRPYVRLMRGRLAKATDPRGKGEPKTMCRKPDAAELAGKLGLNVYRALCKHGETRCEFYDRCPWVEQWEDLRAGVFIFALEYLFLPKLPRFPKPDIVITDESIVETAVGRLEFLPDRLTEAASWKTAEVVDCLKRVRAALESDQPLLAALREAGLSKEELATALNKAEGGAGGSGGVSPDMEEAAAVQHLSALEESERVKIARTLRQLCIEFELPRDICHAVWLWRNKPVRVGGKTERQNRVVVSYRREVLIPKRVPVLNIDADGDVEIGRLILGERLEHEHIPVERNAEVVQCHTSTFSRMSLTGFNGATQRSLAWAAKRLEAVKRLILRRADELSTLVVANLPVRRKITGEKEGEKATLAFEWGPVLISHFGRIRGIDAWKDRQMVIVVGREQPPPEAVEALARGLYCDAPETLELTGAYAKALRGYRLKDGRNVGVEVDVHADPRVQRVLELKRERESAQAIDRIRLVHCDKPKMVLILCNVPLDISVDRLVSWKDLINGGCRLDRALARNGWALPLVPSCLARNWPDLFVSPKAAELEIRRSFENPPASNGSSVDPLKSQRDIYWLLSRSKFRPASEGRGGHRRWSEALVSADTAYYRARVRDAMGCELVWEHPPTCRIFYRPTLSGGLS